MKNIEEQIQTKGSRNDQTARKSSNRRKSDRIKKHFIRLFKENRTLGCFNSMNSNVRLINFKHVTSTKRVIFYLHLSDLKQPT